MREAWLPMAISSLREFAAKAAVEAQSARKLLPKWEEVGLDFFPLFKGGKDFIEGRNTWEQPTLLRVGMRLQEIKYKSGCAAMPVAHQHSTKA